MLLDPRPGSVTGLAFTPDEQVLAVVDDVAPGVTRSLLTNNDALLRDSLPLVLPTVHARIAIPLFSATHPGHQAIAGGFCRRAGCARRGSG